MPYLMLFLSGTMSAIASIFLRVAGRMPDVENMAHLMTMPNLLRVSAIIAYGAGFMLYAFALKHVELSVAYPLMVGVAILEIFGYGLLGGDSVSTRSMLGAALIMSGIWLIYSP